MTAHFPPKQFNFGNITVYTDDRLLARQVYEEINSQRLPGNSGIVMINGKTIRWIRFSPALRDKSG